MVLLRLSGGWSSSWFTGGWLSPFLLAAYAITFSFAYLTLSTVTGALILFGAVQLTMIGPWDRAKDRPGLNGSVWSWHSAEWVTSCRQELRRHRFSVRVS